VLSLLSLNRTRLQDWNACGSLISIPERAAAYEEWARTRLGDFSERMASRLMLGVLVSAVDYVQAVRRRRRCAPNCNRRWPDSIWY
jgi:hypothetical protein